MQFPPTSEAVRALVTSLDELDRRVLGGLVALMITEPSKVRDEEWFAERFVQVAVVAHGFDAEEGYATTAEVEIVEQFAKARMGSIANAAFALFVRTAEELKARGGTYTLDDARAVVVRYLAP